MTKAFRLLKDSKVEYRAKAGSKVYKATVSDHGLARNDEKSLGYPCISVTFDKDGGYPTFVVPAHDLTPWAETEYKQSESKITAMVDRAMEAANKYDPPTSRSFCELIIKAALDEEGDPKAINERMLLTMLKAMVAKAVDSIGKPNGLEQEWIIATFGWTPVQAQHALQIVKEVQQTKGWNAEVLDSEPRDKHGCPLHGGAAMLQGWDVKANPFHYMRKYGPGYAHRVTSADKVCQLEWDAQWQTENARCFRSHVFGNAADPAGAKGMQSDV